MADTANNKIKYGLSNAYYAVVSEDPTTGTITFATPKAIKGAVELSIKAEGGNEGFAADNLKDYATICVNNGYSGDITFAIIPDSFKQDCLGETVNSDGIVIENTNAKPSHFALAFQIDGDVKNRRSVFYYCMASRPDIASKTKSDKTDPQTDKLSITINPRPDTGDIKASTNEATTDTIYDAWFAKVYENSAS